MRWQFWYFLFFCFWYKYFFCSKFIFVWCSTGILVWNWQQFQFTLSVRYGFLILHIRSLCKMNNRYILYIYRYIYLNICLDIRDYVKLQEDTHEEREISSSHTAKCIWNTYHHATCQRNASSAICIGHYVTIADAKKCDGS